MVTPRQILYRIALLAFCAVTAGTVVFIEGGLWDQMHSKEQPPTSPTMSNSDILSGKRAELPSATLKAEQWPNAVPPGIIPDPEPLISRIGVMNSWQEYVKVVNEWREGSGTNIQKAALKKTFNEKYIGERFIWEGYLGNVMGNGILMGFFNRKNKGYMAFVNTASCVFDESWREKLSNLEKGQKITFAGDYNKYRLGPSFRNCEIIEE